MLLEDLINIYEELKQYIYIIMRGDKSPIFIKFRNENFFHLIGLHKTNINTFIPEYIKSKDKKYKYIKKNIVKFNNILLSEIKDKKNLEYRVNTFYQILDLLKGINTTLYNLQPKVSGSLYDGDFGLLKIDEKFNYLFGLVVTDMNDKNIKCAPQSWMASTKINHLIAFKKPIYMDIIISMPINMYDEDNNLINV